MVGCSNGGEIMLDLAIEQPERTASLTMVCSTPSGFERVGEPPRYMMEMFGAAQAGNIDHASELQIRIWLDGMFREPDEMDVALRAKALTMNHIAMTRSTFFIADMQPVNPLTPPALTRLSEVVCPVLVVAGSLDHSEILRAADVLIDGISDARKHIIHATGHVPSYEKPDVFTTLLLDFLGA